MRGGRGEEEGGGSWWLKENRESEKWKADRLGLSDSSSDEEEEGTCSEFEEATSRLQNSNQWFEQEVWGMNYWLREQKQRARGYRDELDYTPEKRTQR